MPDTEAGFDLREENLRLREEILELRDALVGTEAQLAETSGRLRMLENELLRHQVFEQYMNSRTGRLLQTYHRLRSRLREHGLSTVPSLSVLVPVLEDARRLDATVASLRRQSHPAWELVAVLDAHASGATRSTVAAVAASEPRVSVHETADSPGPVAASNEALARALGRWGGFRRAG